MLTQSELAWLNERQICLACEGSYLWGGYWEDGVELKTMQEAAEFEAQVAAQLADIYSEIESEICHVCPVWHLCFGEQDCRATILKYARLQVEEEMDGECQN